MPFVKGKSGNPAGRPKGSGDIAKARQKLLGHADEMIQRLMEKIREGDTLALKLAVERLVPVVKEDNSEKITELPPMQITAFEVVVDEEDSEVLG